MLAAKAQIGNPVMAACLEVTASKVPVIFVYFTAVRGLVKKHPAIHDKIMRRPVQRKHAAEAAHRSRGKQGKASPAFIIQWLSHDLNRHIQSIKELGASGNIEETKKYAEQIGGMLKPLIPTRYTGNAIHDGDLKLRESNGKFIAEFFLNT